MRLHNWKMRERPGWFLLAGYLHSPEQDLRMVGPWMFGIDKWQIASNLRATVWPSPRFPRPLIHS